MKEKIVSIREAEKLATAALVKNKNDVLAATLLLLVQEKRLLFKVLLCIEAYHGGLSEASWYGFGVSLEDTERICAELTAFHREQNTWMCLGPQMNSDQT